MSGEVEHSCFEIEEKDDGAVVVKILDDICTDQIPAFRHLMYDVVSPRFKWVVLDLAGTDYFSSTAYGVILKTLESMREKGGDLFLVNLTPSVLRLFEVTKLKGILNICDSVEEALSRAKGSQVTTGRGLHRTDAPTR